MSNSVRVFGLNGVSCSSSSISDTLELHQAPDDVQKTIEEGGLVLREVIVDIVNQMIPSELKRLSDAYFGDEDVGSVLSFFQRGSASLNTFMMNESDFASEILFETLLEREFPIFYGVFSSVEISESLKRFHLALVPDFFSDSLESSEETSLSSKYHYIFWKLLYHDITAAQENKSLFYDLRRLLVTPNGFFSSLDQVPKYPMLMMFLATADRRIMVLFLDLEWRDSSFLDLTKQEYTSCLTKETTHSVVLISLLRKASFRLNDGQRITIFLNACAGGSLEVMRTVGEFYPAVREFFYQGVLLTLRYGHPELTGYLVSSGEISNTLLYGDIFNKIILNATEVALSLLPIPRGANLMVGAATVVNTALITACKTDHLDFILSLLEDELADLSTLNHLPIRIVLEYSSKTVVENLLDKSKPLRDGDLFLEAAYKNKDPSMLQTLVSHRRFIKSHISRVGVVAFVQFLSENQKDVEPMKVLLESQLDLVGCEFLVEAVRADHMELVKVLLAPKELRFQPEVRYSVLVALDMSHYAVLKFLLKHYPSRIDLQADRQFLKMACEAESKYLELILATVSPVPHGQYLLARTNMRDMKAPGRLIMDFNGVTATLSVDEIRKYGTWLGA